MKRFLRNVTASPLMIDDLGQYLDTTTILEITHLDGMLNDFLSSEDLKEKILAGDIQVGWWGTSFFSNPVEGVLYFYTTFDDNVYITDGTSIEEITVAVVEDTSTGKRSTTYLMNILTIMRELYNATDNPIHIPSGFTPILGASGWAEDHDTRIAALEAAGSGASPNIFQGIATTAQNQTSAADLVIEWDNQYRKDSYYTHSDSTSPGEITINQTGWYKVTYSVSWQKLNSSRTVKRMWVEENGVAIAHSVSYAYIRDDNYGSFGTNSITFIDWFDSGNVIDVHAEQTNNNTIFGDTSASCTTIANECSILIEKVLD